MFKTQMYTSKAWTDTVTLEKWKLTSIRFVVVVVVVVVVLDGERCLSEQLRLYIHRRALS